MEKRIEKHAVEKKHKIPFFRIISFIIVALCLVYIVNWIIENRHSNEIMQVAKEYVIEDENNNDINVDFEKLREINQEVVGWIKVNNTNIDYPVVQSSDNSFYLSHSLDKEYNAAGWPFVDYRVKSDGNDKNITIYGHNRKDGSMFGSLKNILEPEWYENKENLQVTYVTDEGTKTYQVFSVYQIEKETFYTNTAFDNDEEYISFLNELKSRSEVDFNIDLNEEDKILTLSTCATNNFYRVVLHAKLIN